MLFVTLSCCLGHLLFGLVNGMLVLLLVLVLRMLLSGPTLLVFWSSSVAFQRSLHWLAGGVDLGVGGVSYVELLILYELRAGERLTLEKAHPKQGALAGFWVPCFGL